MSEFGGSNSDKIDALVSAVVELRAQVRLSEQISTQIRNRWIPIFAVVILTLVGFLFSEIYKIHAQLSAVISSQSGIHSIVTSVVSDQRFLASPRYQDISRLSLTSITKIRNNEIDADLEGLLRDLETVASTMEGGEEEASNASRAVRRFVQLCREAASQQLPADMLFTERQILLDTVRGFLS